MKSLLATAACFVLFLASLHSQDGTPADIRGVIKTVSPAKPNAAGLLGSILVEGKKEETTTQEKAVLRIGPRTKIERLDGKERKPSTFADLKVGERVQADFMGPVAESFPVQGTAGRILILGK